MCTGSIEPKPNFKMTRLVISFETPLKIDGYTFNGYTFNKSILELT
jgi:hypothetical protein